MREAETITCSTVFVELELLFWARAGAEAAMAKIDDAASSLVLVMNVSPSGGHLLSGPYRGDEVAGENHSVQRIFFCHETVMFPQGKLPTVAQICRPVHS